MHKNNKISIQCGRSAVGWLLATLILTISSGISASEEWIKVAGARDPSEVSIWTRYISGQQMKQFRGETHAGASLASALAMIQDMDVIPSWLYRCKSAKILQRDGNRELYVYLTFSGIWPLRDRDAVIRILPTYDVETGSVTLTGTAAPAFIPPIPDMVRVPAIAATFVFQPKPNNMLRLELTGHFDAGGVVPIWVANMVVTILPKYSLTEMREILEGGYYRSGKRFATGEATLQDVRAGR